MERSIQFKTERYNLLLVKMDERRFDFDASVARSRADKLLKRLIIRRPAVGIAGAVRLHRANEDGLRPQHLGPAYRGGKEMGVAEGNIGYGNRFADGTVL